MVILRLISFSNSQRLELVLRKWVAYLWRSGCQPTWFTRP